LSNRVIAYYKRADAQPLRATLLELARAVRVKTDELLGVKPLSEKTRPKTARLIKRLRRVEPPRPPISAPSSRSSTACWSHGDANGERDPLAGEPTAPTSKASEREPRSRGVVGDLLLYRSWYSRTVGWTSSPASSRS